MTIKPLYGQQEGARVGYNPHKPGRPSHTYHTYMVANIRLVLDVEVQAGNQSSARHSAGGLLDILNSLDRTQRPRFVRGDCDWGCDAVMTDLEAIQQIYLFKLKKTARVKELIHQHHCLGGWTQVKKDWEAKEASIQLSTWSQPRRVVIVRYRFPKDEALLIESKKGQQTRLDFGDDIEELSLFKYSVLVTNAQEDVYGIFQLYRDRADCENVFDPKKSIKRSLRTV